MVAERDFGAAEFFGGAVENAPAQAAAQRTGGFSFVEYALNGGIGVFFDDFVGYADAFEIGPYYLLAPFLRFGAFFFI